MADKRTPSARSVLFVAFQVALPCTVPRMSSFSSVNCSCSSSGLICSSVLICQICLFRRKKSSSVSFRDVIASLRTAVISNKCREEIFWIRLSFCMFKTLTTKQIGTECLEEQTLTLLSVSFLGFSGLANNYQEIRFLLVCSSAAEKVFNIEEPILSQPISAAPEITWTNTGSSTYLLIPAGSYTVGRFRQLVFFPFWPFSLHSSSCLLPPTPKVTWSPRLALLLSQILLVLQKERGEKINHWFSSSDGTTL